MIPVWAYIVIIWGLYRFLKFISTPLLKKWGIYTYHSPFLFSFRRSKKTYELHLGTSWDHIVNPVSTTALHVHVLNGLLEICNGIKNGSIPGDAVITGTIHYLNENSLKKLGLQSKKLSFIDYIFFFLSYPEVILLRFLVSGKLELKSPLMVRLLYSPASGLLLNEAVIAKYRDMLLQRVQKTKGEYLNVA